METGIKIVSAEHAGGYKVRFTFSDGKVNVFDYAPLVEREHEESKPYRDIEKIKQFKVVGGGSELAWGDDWDMVLPLETIYNHGEIDQ
jgi:hypothetical protein